MRVLFTPFPAKAHVYNMAPLIWAMRNAGHEVRIAAQPNPAEPNALSSAGLSAHQAGKPLNWEQRTEEGGGEYTEEELALIAEFPIAQIDEEKITPEYAEVIFDIWAPLCEAMAGPDVTADLVEFAREWKPDLVVWDALVYAGPVAAKACGAAHARLLMGSDNFGRMRKALQEQQRDPMRDWLTGKLGEFGLEFDEDVVLGQLTIDAMPACTRYETDAKTLPVRFTPYNGPSESPKWLRDKPTKPRVCVTVGLSARENEIPNKDDGFDAAELFEAVRGLDVEVVATLQTENAPENVRLVDFVPLNELLPSCAVVVHHGGTGTIGNAVVHGVPQLVIPGSTWGEATAAHELEKAGAALTLRPEEFSAQALRERLVRLLEDKSFVDSAAAVRAEMLGRPTVNDVVLDLEKLAASR
ncbi:activator-dependent family glycosyltransferase [Allokutzneria sp. NRRL B-24872]|uniref:activator-dependent family glycosyltransferase n=1 Tax=Allokutzneria sp. NRRL B-24872 TaxID=1137961 RepID=UPI000A390B2C|nr:activator-dependent family glycosyltransferase [Allokutzneria sp. NRRL B-24872]